ncbi:purine-cytosine permease family protein [Amycolatopsis orientalis]|uniref:purine-cytosine permease family protein n=1 Tax=Amycolatopsis orientalis TaxID=31958 RepID=UPI0003A264F0|nr:permease [Amycolatopsis orientalis]
MSAANSPLLPVLRTRSTDDPDVVAEQRADDYSNHLVPVTARVGRWQLTMSFWSLLSAMVWLFYGALVGSLYGTRDALIAIAVSVASYSLINAVFARWGMRSGLNSTLLSRRMFGAYGASLTALLIAANTTYYAVFESSTLAVAFQHYTPGWDIRVWYAIVAVCMLPLMLGSVQTWMARLNSILLPLYVAGIVAAVVVAAVRVPGTAWLGFAGVVPDQARALPGWLLGAILYMGIYLTMPTTVDFARLARPADRKFHRRVTFTWPFYVWLFAVNGVVGIFLVRTVLPQDPTAETGVVQALLATLGVGGLVLIVVSQTRINSLNYYQASSNLRRVLNTVFGVRIHRLVLVVVVTGLAFLMMLTDVFSYLQRALAWQGVFFVSWVSIMVTHYALVPSDRARGPEFRARRLPAVTWGLGIWVLSSAVGILLTEATWVVPWLKAAAPLAAVVVSVPGYALVLKTRTGMPRSGPDPRLEVADPGGTWLECHRCEKSYVVLEMDRDPNARNAPICDACATARRS